MTDIRTQEIRLGQAMNMAVTYATLSGAVSSPEDAVNLAQEALPTFLEWINKTQLKLAFDIQQTTPLPGLEPKISGPPEWHSGATQHYGKDQTGYAPGQPAMPPPPPGGPAQVPGQSGGSTKTDALWQEYFANPSAFYDNRGNKQNPNSPDLKHKQTREGLWLGGRWPAPQWVLDRMPF